VHSLGGGLGALCGAAVTSPLEVIKTRLQAQRHKQNLQTKFKFGFGTIIGIRNLMLNEGFFGLYRGLFAHCLGVIPSRAIHFYVYSAFKSYLGKKMEL